MNDNEVFVHIFDVVVVVIVVVMVVAGAVVVVGLRWLWRTEKECK